MDRIGIGIDFGTTNSAVAIAAPGDAPRLARIAGHDAGAGSTFRSILYFERDPDRPGKVLELAGPRAIARYLEADEPGRLMQSLKSYLASRLFTDTFVYGRRLDLESLIGIFLARLREEAEASLGPLRGPVVVGRPVEFANAAGGDDTDLALARLEGAFRAAGFPEVVFEFEPVAAAYHYERGLAADELLLIADFGGGTSDFSLLRVGPGARERGARADSILGTAGVAVAGDAFDGRIVRNAVAPVLGLGSEYYSFFKKVLTVPTWIYAQLQRWHLLSFLRTPATLRLLRELQREALHPERIAALLHVVEEDLGFELFRAVEQAKLALSASERVEFRFAHGDVVIEQTITRAGFEAWIAEDVESIAACLDGLLSRTGVAPGEVDRVFLTGGSSRVPAVRRLFVKRFGAARIRAGGELTSVASGLALRALEHD